MSILRSFRDRLASRRRGITALLVVAAGAAIGVTKSVSAHGFGQRYDLPLPLSLYLLGTAAAVVVTFVIVGLFVRAAPRAQTYLRVDLLAHPLGRLIAHSRVALTVRLVSLVLFVVTVLAGLWGSQNPLRNIAPTMVWIIWWVGLAYVSAFFGNLWSLINPWRTIFEGAEWLYRRIAHDRDLSLRLPYPVSLGVWPAFFLLLAFSWIELVYPSSAVPAHIAWLAYGYSSLTFLGMVVFGAETWLRHGEVFTLMFGTFARFAPTEVRVRDRTVCERCEFDCRNLDGECIDCCHCFRRAGPQQREWALRPFGAGLLDSRSVSTSMTAFVLLLLAMVLYDGVLTTPSWSSLETDVLARIPAFGDVSAIVVRTIGVAACWLLFFGAYLAVCIISSVMVSGRRAPLELARDFAFTFVPIAIGYHVAHYLTFLLVQGQYIIPLTSDPFGIGWNLFGTAGYRVDIAVVGARFAWYTAVTAIVVGHIAAVYLAHIKAMWVLDTRAAALRSQVPLTALMVGFTFVSLSILAEPLTERRVAAQRSAVTPAEINVPKDAVLPEVGGGRLQAVGPGKTARSKLTYRVLGSAFHDGTKMSVADLLYSYMFAYRWGARNAASAPHYDFAIDTATALMREHLVGVRVMGTDTTSKSVRFGDFTYVRELFVIEVYATNPPFEPEQDAVVAPPWSTLPWHLTVLMEEAVSRGLAAFSQAEAARRGVEWLDLVRSEPMKRQLAALVATFEYEGYRPEILQSLVSVDEARKRWTALAAFYKEHDHFLVSNGPYQLKGWSADRVVLEAFRDLSYPLGVGSYDAYAVPRRAFITRVERENDRIKLFSDVELIMKHLRSYDIVRKPLESVPMEVLKRAAPECRYVVLDAEGRAVLAGQINLADDLSFQIDLSGKLPPGRFTLRAQTTVNGNTLNADIQRIPVVISSSP